MKVGGGVLGNIYVYIINISHYVGNINNNPYELILPALLN